MNLVIIIAPLMLAVASIQIRAHYGDGQKSTMIYAGHWKDGPFGLYLHNVQEVMTYTINGLVGVVHVLAVLLLMVHPIDLLLLLPGAGLVTLGGALWGDYEFQRGVELGVGHPFPDPNEKPRWFLPRNKTWHPKLFYGKARRYQRPVAGVMIALGLGLVLLEVVLL